MRWNGWERMWESNLRKLQCNDDKIDWHTHTHTHQKRLVVKDPENRWPAVIYDKEQERSVITRNSKYQPTTNDKHHQSMLTMLFLPNTCQQ